MPFADATAPGLQPYKYNGKELDTRNGLNQYDFSARYMDFAFPHFPAPDPLAEKFYSWSPYVYCYNNPVNFIDPDGRWGIAVHYSMTQKTMLSLGYSHKDADKVAYMASTYADHPPVAIAMASGVHLQYGSYGVQHDKGPTRTSQIDNPANTPRHAMRSTADAKEGMTAEVAIDRGINFGWDNVLDAAKNNDQAMLGVGLHALQDVSAHKGASSKEHIGLNTTTPKYLAIDLGFSKDRQAANAVTKSALTIYGIITGNQKVIDKAKDKHGNITLKMEGGMNNESWMKVINAINNSGYEGNVFIQF
jgi:RHS repeat-associated protein